MIYSCYKVPYWFSQFCQKKQIWMDILAWSILLRCCQRHHEVLLEQTELCCQSVPLLRSYSSHFRHFSNFYLEEIKCRTLSKVNYKPNELVEIKYSLYNKSKQCEQTISYLKVVQALSPSLQYLLTIHKMASQKMNARIHIIKTS